MQKVMTTSTTLLPMVLTKDQTAEFAFPLSPFDTQVDLAYFDRPGEVHVNLALGRLCPVGCHECSATIMGRQLSNSLRGNLSPATIRRKVSGILTDLRPLLNGRSVVMSAMNDGDPLTRSTDDLIEVVVGVLGACQAAHVPLERFNLSSSIVPTKFRTVIDLADRYEEVFGQALVQFQASLLATNVKRNIFTGDGSHLRTIINTLGYYQTKMRLAAGRGDTWINYVAVKHGDFGRADSAEQLESIAKVADLLAARNPDIKLKITRGTVDDLDGWQQLNDDEYADFVQAVRERWGSQIAIYCPDGAGFLPESYRCGRVQTLTAHIQ